MRTMLFAFLFSFSAFACPDLSGSYSVCRSSNVETPDMFNVVVSQRLEGDATVYSISSNLEEAEYKTDGVPTVAEVTEPTTGMTFRVTSTSRCDGQRVLVIKTDLAINGEHMGSVSTDVTKSGDTLTMVMTGYPDGETVSDTMECR